MAVLLLIAVVEVLAPKIPGPGLLQTGAARMVEILLVLVWFWLSDAAKGLAAIGLDRERLAHGVKKGLLWSAGCGVASGVAGGVLLLFGINPLDLLGGRMPEKFSDIVLYYLIGGIIAPVAEEMVFRGVIYGYFRHQIGKLAGRWAVPAAIVLTTGLFAAAHQTGGIPIPQTAGGIVFCIAYEIEKSLVTPMMIHSAGNLALFTLAFF